ALLQGVRGRVRGPLFVPHLALVHRLAHALGRARLGVAEQVDHVSHQPSSRRNSAIRMTALAASSPLCRFPPPARASACSIVSTVSTPNATGTPVSSDTRAIPFAASLHT